MQLHKCVEGRGQTQFLSGTSRFVLKTGSRTGPEPANRQGWQPASPRDWHVSTRPQTISVIFKNYLDSSDQIQVLIG